MVEDPRNDAANDDDDDAATTGIALVVTTTAHTTIMVTITNDTVDGLFIMIQHFFFIYGSNLGLCWFDFRRDSIL